MIVIELTQQCDRGIGSNYDVINCLKSCIGIIKTSIGAT